jgi:hypothetical protein
VYGAPNGSLLIGSTTSTRVRTSAAAAFLICGVLLSTFLMWQVRTSAASAFGSLQHNVAMLRDMRADA